MTDGSPSAATPPPAFADVIDDVADAVKRLRAGGLVAIPTETVYGLAADAERPDAVARIFTAKGRPTGHPLIVHLASGDQLTDGWADLSDPRVAGHVARLSERVWPGPLTMLVPAGRRVDPAVTGGRTSVGIRVPAHPSATAILTAHGGGLAAPSANRFGKVSPTSAADVVADLAGVLDPARDAVFDGGRSAVGVESTIVDLTVTPPQVVRTGAIGADDIARILDTPLAEASGPSRAAGMLASHYSPDCELLLADTAADGHRLTAAATQAGRRARLLDRTDDLVVAAHELYADLRAADRDDVDTLVVVLPPAIGLGHALRDRLTKAAAPTR